MAKMSMTLKIATVSEVVSIVRSCEGLKYKSVSVVWRVVHICQVMIVS